MPEPWEDGYDPTEDRDDTLAFLTGVRAGEAPGSWIGDLPPRWDARDGMFGGCIVGQSITAFTRDIAPDRRLHSLHAYFLRPTGGGAPITYEVEPIRDGRAFSTRRLQASQRGKEIFEAIASFTADTDGYRYDLPPTSPLPSRDDGTASFGPGGMEGNVLGWSEERADGTYESTDRKWFRLPTDIGDDPHLHTAYFGMMSDWTGIGSRPRKLSWDTEEYGIASLDHAVWFHRPARINDWHYSDMHALVNHGGRSQVRMTVRNEAGEVVVSMAQELLVKVLD